MKTPKNEKIMMVSLRKNTLILMILAAGLCTVLLAGCGGKGDKGPVAKGNSGEAKPAMKKPEKPKFKIPVTVDEIERGRMYSYLEAVGTVVPFREVEIKPEMSGRIFFSKPWKEGNEVKKGTVYATLDDRQLKLDINNLELDLSIAKAKVRPASAQLMQAYKEEEFKKAMYERGAIAKADYDLSILQRIQRENAYEETLKNIQAREMALEKMKQEREKVEVVIPFDGVLLPPTQSSVGQSSSGEVDLTLLNNQLVGASTVLCRLADLDQVYVALDVPAKDLTEISVGQDVEIIVYSKSGNEYKGKVAEISTSLSQSTRTYTVNVLVDNPAHELRPGMFAKARVITKEKKDAISIPRSLVLLRNNQHVVFVAEEKPVEEPVEDVTTEIQIAPVTQEENKPKKGGLEKVAVAAELIQEATEEEFTDEEFLPAEPEQPPMIARERVIELGIDNRERVEVVSGLQEGDLLIVLGYETLTDKVDVNVTYRDPEDKDIELPSN